MEEIIIDDASPDDLDAAQICNALVELVTTVNDEELYKIFHSLFRLVHTESGCIAIRRDKFDEMLTRKEITFINFSEEL